jgi:hypothetical protein
MLRLPEQRALEVLVEPVSIVGGCAWLMGVPGILID